MGGFVGGFFFFSVFFSAAYGIPFYSLSKPS